MLNRYIEAPWFCRYRDLSRFNIFITGIQNSISFIWISNPNYVGKINSNPVVHEIRLSMYRANQDEQKTEKRMIGLYVSIGYQL